MSFNSEQKIKRIQTILGVTPDGIWGPKSKAALSELVDIPEVHHGKASSFADPEDVKKFKKCKASGGTDEECFKVGDNGVGCWEDDTSEGSGPSCALPPEDMEEKWGSVSAAKHKLVNVVANSKFIQCVLKDRMPHKANITNGAIIDLNPDACGELGLTPPILVPAAWSWAP